MIVKPKYAHSSLSQSNFQRISKYILENYGINLTASKHDLLEFRLQKRLQILNIDTYEAYTRFLFSKEGIQTEPREMINEVSTNKTDFFRENQHFELLQKSILPNLAKEFLGKTVPIWSAGCSSGEEVYSLGITLENFKIRYPDFNYSILGTDISQSMIFRAQRAIYPIETVSPVSHTNLHRYFLKSLDTNKYLVRVKKKIRDKVHFDFLNLMDKEYRTPHIYPIIFCRNTLMSFNQETKMDILRKFHERLKTNGLLFISHTESLIKLDQRFKLIYPSVYQKTSSI